MIPIRRLFGDEQEAITQIYSYAQQIFESSKQYPQDYSPDDTINLILSSESSLPDLPQNKPHRKKIKNAKYATQYVSLYSQRSTKNRDCYEAKLKQKKIEAQITDRIAKENQEQPTASTPSKKYAHIKPKYNLTCKINFQRQKDQAVRHALEDSMQQSYRINNEKNGGKLPSAGVQKGCLFWKQFLERQRKWEEERLHKKAERELEMMKLEHFQPKPKAKQRLEGLNIDDYIKMLKRNAMKLKERLLDHTLNSRKYRQPSKSQPTKKIASLSHRRCHLAKAKQLLQSIQKINAEESKKSDKAKAGERNRHISVSSSSELFFLLHR